MSQRTSIEWTNESSNPIKARRKSDGKLGHHCVMVSPGCAHCYSATWNGWRGNGVPFTRAGLEQVEHYLDEKELARLLRSKKPRKVFVGDMTDLFGDWVPDEWLDRIFAVMALTPHVTYQLLTKRADRMRDYFRSGRGMLDRLGCIGLAAIELTGDELADSKLPEVLPLPGVWLGVSVEDQQRADERIPLLLQTPAAVRFLSCEPLLAGLDLTRIPAPNQCRQNALTGRNDRNGRLMSRIDWVIVGGESGPGARPCDLAWIRSIVGQCQAAGVSCFTKQLGSVPIGAWQPLNGCDSLAVSQPFFAGHWRLSDRKGGDWSEWPDDLRIRQFPSVAR